MGLSLLIYGFAPLLVYLIFDYWKGFRAGLIAAILVSLATCIIDYVRLGSVDLFVLGETGLILLLAFVSLKLNQDRYFKFQPTVLAVILASVFAYFQIFDEPLLVRYLPRFEKLIITPEQKLELRAKAELSPSEEQLLAVVEQIKSPETLVYMAKVSGAFSWTFLAHGAVMAYAALRLSTGSWFLWRLAIYPAIFLVALYYRIMLL